METTLRDRIQTIPLGKSLGLRGAETYAFVARRPEGLVVECGWTVPEAHDDDADSYAYNPFKGVRATPPWVGRRQVCATPEEAADVYSAYKQAVAVRRLPAGGEVIGSVSREHWPHRAPCGAPAGDDDAKH